MKKKTAVLVIHGIGEQESFETLDAFAKPFSDLYCELVGKKYQNVSIQKKHALVQFPGWAESCVSLKSGAEDLPDIDIYEYYWAYLAEREITAAEVMDWIFKVADGAKAFYQEKKSTGEGGKNDILFSQDGEFRSLKYLVGILSFGNVFRFLGLLLSQHLPESVKKLVSAALKGPLVDAFGDVALYTSSDMKSKYFEVRSKILNGAVEKLTFLMKSGSYDEIILAGHSLGTVIAYDSLARLNTQMNVDLAPSDKARRITGLVTFGSPLDKIAFFFDEKIDRDRQPVRSAITSQLHGFKKVNVDAQALDNGVGDYFKHVKWLNFWSERDPVSGHLDVYRDLENIKMDFSKLTVNPIKTHSMYWQSMNMYERIIDDFQLV
ncbi:MAG: hypothetical protein PHF12_00535 [Candidatus Omnitrophica bacterium]|nr:hypothetical protein [Candidatus Omnitrophota bacterium]